MKRVYAIYVYWLSILFLAQACGPELNLNNPVAGTSSSSSSYPGSSEPAARFIFHEDNFTNLSDYVTSKHTQYQCLGDVLKTYYVTGPDYTGTANLFPYSATSDDFQPTTMPSFVKNVSVDLTQTYFALTQSNVIQTDACSYRNIAGTSDPSPCADFDDTPPAAPAPTVAPTPTPSPTVAPVATPTSTPYYGSKFYQVRDDWCTGQGPLVGPGPDASKAYVGGVNLDIDRTQLGTSEDLLMLVTYQALNANAAWPSVQGTNDETILNVKLIGTSLGLDILLGARQPLSSSDYANPNYVIYTKELATLRDPFASLRTEQVYIPLSENALIDRIRLERVRGSFELYQIDLYRLGNRGL